MDLKDFIAIRGKGDLYRVMSKTPKGIIVETLNEKRTKFKVQPNLQVLVLNDITIYSKSGEDIRLLDVFLKLNEKFDKKAGPDFTEALDIIGIFKDVADGYDEDKVYLSDMKKTLRWYNTITAFYPSFFEDIKLEMEKEEHDAAGNEVEEEVEKPALTEDMEEKKKEKAAAKKKTTSKPKKD